MSENKKSSTKAKNLLENIEVLAGDYRQIEDITHRGILEVLSIFKGNHSSVVYGSTDDASDQAPIELLITNNWNAAKEIIFGLDESNILKHVIPECGNVLTDRTIALEPINAQQIAQLAKRAFIEFLNMNDVYNEALEGRPEVFKSEGFEFIALDIFYDVKRNLFNKYLPQYIENRYIAACEAAALAGETGEVES